MPEFNSPEFARVPLSITDSENGTKKFKVDVTRPTGTSIVNSATDNKSFMEFQFTVPDLKVPPTSSRPPGATHVCDFPFDKIDDNTGILRIELESARAIFKVDPDNLEKTIGTFFFLFNLGPMTIIPINNV